MACLPGCGSQCRHNGPIVVPVMLSPLISDYFHLFPLAGGLLSFKKVLHKTAPYHLSTTSADLYRWIKACLICQMFYNPQPYPHVPSFLISSFTVFMKTKLDLSNPLPPTS